MHVVNDVIMQLINCAGVCVGRRKGPLFAIAGQMDHAKWADSMRDHFGSVRARFGLLVDWPCQPKAHKGRWGWRGGGGFASA
jgi:hypothetical protein